jgi:hypothetical protein
VVVIRRIKMDYIIVYEKKKGNPIFLIEPKLISNREKLQDYFPHLDPHQFGFVIAPEEITTHLEIIEYETDKKGGIIFETEFREVQKKLFSKFDSAYDKNILIFEQSISEIVSIVDLKNKKVKASIVDAKQGIIEVGDKRGYFTVTCKIEIGKQPKIKSRKKNWKWIKSKGKITGIGLIDKSVLKS